MTAASDRVASLLRGARRLVDPRDPIGAELRTVLPAVTRLSAPGVELALRRCFEVDASEGEIASLCASVAPAPRAHVILSANVFTAALRAIALGLAASASVSVRPSRREPFTVEWLSRAAEGLFEVTDRVEPSPGDHVWLYGSDETIRDFRKSLSPGVALHAHGTGIGVVVTSLDAALSRGVPELCRALAEDVVLFDQRGCLSPRVVLSRGSQDGVLELCEQLAVALAEQERGVPLGVLSEDEAADVTRFRSTAVFAGPVLPAASGCVSADLTGERVIIPPVGRNVHVVRTDRPEALLPGLSRYVTTVGIEPDDPLRATVQSLLPEARIAALGTMQRPPFDGPVDRRSS